MSLSCCSFLGLDEDGEGESGVEDGPESESVEDRGVDLLASLDGESKSKRSGS